MPVFAFMKLKKYKKEQQKIVQSFGMPDLSNVMYAFFIAISILYGTLIWSAGEAFRYDKGPTVPKTIPTYSPLEGKIKKLVTGYPIDGMTRYISKQDGKTAAFLIGVAKKESNWGKYSPKKEGKECYNYWGYRGTYNQTQSGYSCFDSPRQAVEVVSKRMKELMAQEIDTPEEMVVWKCGRMESCLESGAAQKWIDDVDLYHSKFY